MQALRTYLTKHAIAIAFALVVGTLSALPQFLAPLALHGEYKGLQFLYIDDELTYRSLIEEVLDGHPSTASPHLYEYKDSPTIVYPTGDYFYALPALLFGLSITVTLSKFFFPALLFFLVYLFMRKLTGGEGRAAIVNAIVAGLMVTLGMELIDITYLKSLLSGGPDITHLVLWTRLVNPITGALLLFGFFVMLWKVVEEGKKRNIVIAALLAALTVGYFFSLALTLIFTFTLLLLFLIERKKVESKRLSAVLFLTLLFQSPYWHGALTALGGPEGRELEERNGMFFTHAPMVNKLLLATTIFMILSFLYARLVQKRKDGMKVCAHPLTFITALVIASWVAYNQQIITGREIWPFHFVQYTIPICFIVSLFTLYFVWRQSFPRLWKGGVIFLAVLALYSGLSSANSYKYNLSEFKTLQQDAPALVFLNQLPDKDCVVFVVDQDKLLERLIPAYTRCDVYSSGYNFYGIPADRLLFNYMIGLRMNGITADTIDDYLDTHGSEVRSIVYGNWTQVFSNTRDAWLTAQLADVGREYKEFLKGGLEVQIKKYRVDYIFSSRILTTDITKQLPGLTKVGVFGGVNVYTFALK